jgi:hypothetical protein
MDSTQVEERGMIIEIDPWEYEHASNIGVRRFTANWGKQNAAHYDQSRMEPDRTAQVAACLCELAVAKHLNQYWSGHVWPGSEHHKYKHLADVGTSIEVRRVRTRNAVAARKHQVGNGLVLWAARVIDPEFTSVELLGWIDYDTGWSMGSESGFNDNTRYVPLDSLEKP